MQSLIFVVFAALCVFSHAELRSNKIQTPKDDGTLSFLVVGDWGGQPKDPYTTKAELAVAKAMATTAVLNGTEFVFAVGDNFYNDGVTDVNDPRFQATFENVFTQDSLQVPWYVVAGNHDHNGNVSAQIAYSSVSSRWTFPSEYYTFRQNRTDSKGSYTVQFIMIDTVDIDNSDPDQVAWIKQQLQAGINDGVQWALILGHYPFYSVAEHGSTQSLQDALTPLLSTYQVGAYLCGHDHDLQHIRVPGLDTDFFVSGAGHDLELNHDHDSTVPDGALLFYYPSDGAKPVSNSHGGFISVRMWRDVMQVDYRSHTNDLLYSVTHNNPRSS